MDELVKSLRDCAKVNSLSLYKRGLMKQAADAIEELSKPRWIPVTERLPDGRDSVLALTGDCDIYVCDYIPSVKQFWTIPGDELHIDDITHWMPLPEPPEEGE